MHLCDTLYVRLRSLHDCNILSFLSVEAELIMIIRVCDAKACNCYFSLVKQNCKLCLYTLCGNFEFVLQPLLDSFLTNISRSILHVIPSSRMVVHTGKYCDSSFILETGWEGEHGMGSHGQHQSGWYISTS